MIEMLLRFLIFQGNLLSCLLGIWFVWKVLSNPFNFDESKKGKKKGDFEK